MVFVSAMTPESMEQRLKDQFPECDVVVVDLTGTQNHYEVRIASPHFAGLSRIAQHKSVMSVFDDELKSGEVHALTIKTLIK